MADQEGANNGADMDNDEQDVARATAEVAAMQDGNNARRAAGAVGARTRDTTAEDALMGAAGEGVGGFELMDEEGEMVRVRFNEFLHLFSQGIEDEDQSNDRDDEDEDEDDSLPPREAQTFFPYVEQAQLLARRQLPAATEMQDDGQEVDETAETERYVFQNTMLVDFVHLRDYDLELAEAIETDMVRFESYLRKAVKAFMLEKHPELDDPETTAATAKNYFVGVYNLPHTLPVRHLRTDQIGRLAAISGTVTRTSDVRPELLVGCFRCNKCGLLAESVAQQYHFTRPLLCRNPRCQNRSPNEFLLEMNDSDGGRSTEFVDWQKLRVQENANEIPPGSMPRSIDVILRNEMVERAKAGDKCVFTGSLVVIPDGSALARAGEAAQARKGGNGRGSGGAADAATGGGGGVRGLSALGVKELTYKTCFVACTVLPADAVSRGHHRQGGASAIASLLFGSDGSGAIVDERDQSADEVMKSFTEEEREEIRQMRKSPQLYSQMVNSIAPNTFGHTEVKRGILLMLLGGVHKTTTEGIRLRGDINVCIVGDPSTAKSQFLKYVHAFLPSRAVYTSGKAASAAGLTAAVMRDQDTGEYCIEAGALMLADNGICCIDEFDKMDPTDQVAIHEAMEQQTITLTKAGIQATLNARASILAAANPIYGRYDRTKTLKANVALSAPILSRFDLFFVVLDECDEIADFNVATHILNVHRCEEKAVRPPFTKEQMQRYIRFARALNPRITPECMKYLVDCYCKLRQGDSMGRSRTAYRITVRQLESMIRLSEALARLHCSDVIQPSYVKEAFRLLRKSIIHVETEDITFDNEEFDEEEGMENPGRLEAEQTEGDITTANPVSPEKGENSANANIHPGEYAPGEEVDTPREVGTTRKRNSEEMPSDSTETSALPKKKAKKASKKKKTQISFEEYEAISNAIATFLRSKEGGKEDEDEARPSSRETTWGDAVEWYLAQCEDQMGDSTEELERLRKLTNLVIRRLIRVDHVLIELGSASTGDEETDELNRIIAVHPNFAIN